MKLKLNGESIEVDGELTLKALLEGQGFDPAGVAAAINQEFVSRTNYETTTLKADDDIEIVAPMQGG
jgi:sulfur carrier protein